MQSTQTKDFELTVTTQIRTLTEEENFTGEEATAVLTEELYAPTGRSEDGSAVGGWRSIPGVAGQGTEKQTRPAQLWSDLWKAPLHDFPVRDEILYQCVRLRPKMNILEIGPGSGFTAFCLARSVRQLTLMDVSEAAIRDLTDKLGHLANVRFIQGDAAADSFAERSNSEFDLAFGLDVFEYVRDAEGCLRNLASKLRPGGQLFLTYPNSSPELGDGVNYFARLEELEELLAGAGFEYWQIYSVRPSRYSAFIYDLMHEWPLKLYRKLRRSQIKDLPQTYEATWAFKHGRKLERYKPLVHLYWALLAGALRLGGDFFETESVDSSIVGKQLVIEAWK